MLKLRAALDRNRFRFFTAFIIVCLLGVSFSERIEDEDYEIYAKRDVQGSITPQGLCWEEFEGSTFVYWSYINAGASTAVSVGSSNQFGVNGAVLKTSLPPSNFTSGETPVSGLIFVNLGPQGLLFHWTIQGQTSYINGTNPTHNCPQTAYTVAISCLGSTVNVASTISAISSLLSINASRITAQQVPNSKRDNLQVENADFVLDITIESSTTELSALWASYRLTDLITNDQNARNTLETAIGSTIVSSRGNSGTITVQTPLGPVVPKKHEIWLGTILGIVFSALFGITIFIMVVITVLFRVHAWQEQRKYARMTAIYKKAASTNLDTSGQFSGARKVVTTNSHANGQPSSQGGAKKRRQ